MKLKYVNIDLGIEKMYTLNIQIRSPEYPR